MIHDFGGRKTPGVIDPFSSQIGVFYNAHRQGHCPAIVIESSTPTMSFFNKVIGHARNEVIGERLVAQDQS